MIDLVNKIAIIRSSTFYDRFNLVWIVKETAATMSIRIWDPRSCDWKQPDRRNDKGIVQILNIDPTDITAEQLNLLEARMRSAEAAYQEKQRKLKRDLYETMGKLSYT